MHIFFLLDGFTTHTHTHTHADRSVELAVTILDNCLEASKVLPHFQNYTSLSTKPVINAWRGGGRWFSWQFLVDEVRGESMAPQLKPCTRKVRGTERQEFVGFSLRTEVFSAHRGGNQGGEGVKTGGQWWIENVLEDLVSDSDVSVSVCYLSCPFHFILIKWASWAPQECDAPNEFFYDHESRMLYFSFNGTNTEPDGSEQWVLPVKQVLLNITSSDSSLRCQTATVHLQSENWTNPASIV